MSVLEPDPCCINGLSWRVNLAASTVDVARALRSMAFVDDSHVPYVQNFVHETHDRFVLVPKTGRVQLRLSLLVDRDERPVRAQTWVRWLLLRLANP